MPSGQVTATANREIIASQVTSLVCCQQQNSPCNIFWLSNTAQWKGCASLLQVSLYIAHQCSCLSCSRCHNIDADAVWTQFRDQHFHQGFDGCFAGGMWSASRWRFPRDQATDRDEIAALALDHQRCQGTCRMIDTCQLTQYHFLIRFPA